MPDVLEAITIGPEDARYSIIWLHGLGASGHDFEPIVPELQFKHKNQTRFIFPHAPLRAVTINNGYVMPAWYDIRAIALGAPDDEAGIRQSASQVSDLIALEKQRGIDSQRIVLAGFSQGGAVVLHTGLRYPQRLAGIMALSTYLPLANMLAAEADPANRDIPLYMAHGDYDPVVPLELAEHSRDKLFALNYQVNWHSYPMEHSVIPQEIEDISRWLGEVLA